MGQPRAAGPASASRALLGLPLKGKGPVPVFISPAMAQPVMTYSYPAMLAPAGAAVAPAYAPANVSTLDGRGRRHT